MDFVGIVLFVAGLLLFLMGLSWGGQLYPWRSAHVIATIVVGLVLLIVFGFYGENVWRNKGLKSEADLVDRSFRAAPQTTCAHAPVSESRLQCDCDDDHSWRHAVLFSQWFVSRSSDINPF